MHIVCPGRLNLHVVVLFSDLESHPDGALLIEVGQD
jgi:hypothetical protein